MNHLRVDFAPSGSRSSMPCFRSWSAKGPLTEKQQQLVQPWRS